MLKRTSLTVGTLLLIALLFASVLPVFAGVSTFTGAIPSSAGAMSGVYACTLHGWDVNYITKTVNVTASGDYVIYDTGYYDSDDSTLDILVNFYSQGNFNPAAPLNNCVDGVDDSGTATLGAGTYTMVISSYEELKTGNFTFSFDGPGDIVEVGANCPYPLSTSAVQYQIPAGAPVFYAADLATQLTWSIPAGTWWVNRTSGDFAQVWIACQAQPVWVPLNAVLR